MWPRPFMLPAERLRSASHDGRHTSSHQVVQLKLGQHHFGPASALRPEPALSLASAPPPLSLQPHLSSSSPSSHPAPHRRPSHHLPLLRLLPPGRHRRHGRRTGRCPAPRQARRPHPSWRQLLRAAQGPPPPLLLLPAGRPLLLAPLPPPRPAQRGRAGHALQAE